MTFTLFASAVLLGSSAGCTPSTSSNESAAAASFDQEFIDMMTPHHEGAVTMATIAQERGEHAEVKTMASDIIAAQNKEIAQMKAWRKEWYGSDKTPPMDKMPMLPGMAMGAHVAMGDMMKTNEALKTATPFDKAFIDAMIPHHQMAIDGATLAESKATHPEVKNAAGKIIEAQKKEIAQMKAWRAAWYP